MGDTAEQTNTPATNEEVASNIVKPEVASDGNGKKAETLPTQSVPQYLTLEQARLLFKEEAEKVNKEADKKVSGIQSAKDRQIKKLEAVIKNIQEKHGIEDTAVNAARYEVAGTVDTQFDAEEQQREALAAFDENFRATIATRLADFDIDPKDKRIDWAADMPVNNAKLDKVMASIGKIHRENVKKFKEETEAKVRKESGVDEIIPASPSVEKNKIENLSPAERVKERDRRLRENKK